MTSISWVSRIEDAKESLLRSHWDLIIVDEAHKRSMKVVVHATALSDVKDLLRAGVDGLAHLPNDMDEELMGLLKTRPRVFFTPTLGTNRRTVYHPWLDDPVEPLVRDTVSPAQITRLKERLDAPGRGRKLRPSCSGSCPRAFASASAQTPEA